MEWMCDVYGISNDKLRRTRKDSKTDGAKQTLEEMINERGIMKRDKAVRQPSKSGKPDRQ